MILKPTKPKTEIKEDRTIKSHPAFGQVSFSRVSGDSKLYGSEITSGTFIRCTIRESEEHWHLHEKWYFANGIIAEFDLSPNQFATLLTSMNVGNGVPCTIRVKNGAQIEDFIDNETVHDLIQNDLKQDVSEISESVKRLQKEMNEILGKPTILKSDREKLKNIVAKIKQDIDCNMPFVLEQYQEAADKIAASSKAEVDAFVTRVINELGIKSLGQLQKSLQ